jgi:hypothetical protein
MNTALNGIPGLSHIWTRAHATTFSAIKSPRFGGSDYGRIRFNGAFIGERISRNLATVP